MSGRAQHLYERLSTEADLALLLFGQPEDVYIDAKEWHASKEKECLAKIVEAACGFTNASGGIVAVGLSARKDHMTGHDLISGMLPFPNPGAVAARVLDIIVQQIEPGIAGLQKKVVASSSDPNKGIVLLYVPESLDLHRRLLEETTSCKELVFDHADGVFPDPRSIRAPTSCRAFDRTLFVEYDENCSQRRPAMNGVREFVITRQTAHKTTRPARGATEDRNC